MKSKLTAFLILILALAFSACSTKGTGAAIPLSSEPAATSISVEPTLSDTAAKSVENVNNDIRLTHESPDDYIWDSSSVITVTLEGNTATTGGSGVSIDGSQVTITEAGTYNLSGTLTDGQLKVDTKDEETVRIILDGVSITSKNSAPIYVKNAEKVVLILAENSENTLTDGSDYVYENDEVDEPNAALFSDADLTVYGSGELTVTGNYNDGIVSKDGLIFAGGNIKVSAADDGVRGKDYAVLKEGTLTISATGDGLKADNEDDTSLGYITVLDGSLTITAGGDAINAQTSVHISGGNFTLASGGGSGTWLDKSTSAKGIKGLTNVLIDGGVFNINAADDGIHSNGEITVNGGTFSIASGDDGMHADAVLTINDGEIVVSESYEGIESAVITINEGSLHINASDDGINVASGVDGSGMNNPMFGGGNQGTFPAPGSDLQTQVTPDANQQPFPVQGGVPGNHQFPGGGQGGPGQDAFSTTGDYYLYINGGYVYVDADGDGIDVNGTIEMTNGLVIVNGPTENMNGALDYLGTFTISGGTLVAAGSAGMTQGFSETSTQNSMLVNFDTQMSAGTVINVQSANGENMLTFIPTKSYQSVVFSSPNLETGAEYAIYTGGSVSGDTPDGLMTTGNYTPGTQYATFTISSVVTRLGNTSGMGGGHRR